jgi:hypothetical protein
MRDMPAVEWCGASGQSYAFHAYELPQTFPKGYGGTYIYCRLSEGRWQPICIGHGEFSECIGDRHPEAELIHAKGATHVHLRPSADLSCRESEHRDLLEAQRRDLDEHRRISVCTANEACPI